MDDVTNPEQVVNQSAGAEPAVPSTDGENGAEGAGAQAPASNEPDYKFENTKLKSQIENLNKALKVQRGRQRNSSAGDGFPQLQEGDENIYQHPFVQDMLLKNATYQMKEGVGGILDQYPQLPKAVVAAIRRNPRAWVNDGTTDVNNALIDIEENILSYIQEEGLQQQGVQPAQVPIARQNATPGAQSDVEAEITRLVEIPPEDWTDEEAKMVREFTRKTKKSR